eukprot:scaffold1211_cov295-Pavlova_lutheri.AAC.12
MPAPTTFLFLRFVVPEPFPCFSSTCRNPRGSPPRLQMLRIGSVLSTPHPGGDISVGRVGGAIEEESNRDESGGYSPNDPPGASSWMSSPHPVDRLSMSVLPWMEP